MPPAILNADEIAGKFSESLRVLAKLQGFSERTVTLAEAGVVLKSVAGKTKVTNPEKIAIRARKRVLKKLGLTQADRESPSINAGSRGPAGRVWWKTKNGLFQLAGQMSDDAYSFKGAKTHFKDKDWQTIGIAVDAYSDVFPLALERANKSAGLARQAWIQIADDLGIILEDVPGKGIGIAGIKKARKAIASDGKLYQNGVGHTEYEENKSFFVTLVNRLPYWPKIQLDSVLLAILAGRAKYFQQNVDRAVFASHSATVKAYPWLKLVGAES